MLSNRKEDAHLEDAVGRGTGINKVSFPSQVRTALFSPLNPVRFTHSAVGKTPPFLLPLRDSQDSADLTELRRFLFASSISKRGESKALPPCWAAAFRSDGFPSRPAPLCALSSACSHRTAPRGPTAPTRLQVGRPNLWDFPSSSLEDDFILLFFF